MFDTANFEIPECGTGYILLKDVGPWHEYKTITNAAEQVVARLFQTGWLHPDTRLFYYDSNGELSELLIKNGKFEDFRLAGEHELDQLRRPGPIASSIPAKPQPERDRGNEPAFARPHFENAHGASSGFEGLNKLEYFAGQAMHGLLAGQGESFQFGDITEYEMDENGNHFRDENGNLVRRVIKTWKQLVAEQAVELAQHLIEELNRQEAK